MLERKYIVKTEKETFYDLSFDESYKMFDKLRAQGIHVSVIPEQEPYIEKI